MDYVNGDDVTSNKHLAEAIDMTREGSAPADGTTDYDEEGKAGAGRTLRDSAFFVAIEQLEEISTAPAPAQEEIDAVLQKLRAAQNADPERQARVMADAHETLQDLWVPPE